MKKMKKIVCLAVTMAFLFSNSAMAAENIRIGGHLDRTDCDVLLIAVQKDADKDSFSGADVSFVQQQHVDKDGYFTIELPLGDDTEYDFYSNAKLRALSPDGTRSGSVFVSSAGDDTNDGSSVDTPMATLEAAYKRALALEYEKIIIMSDTDYVQCPSSYEGSFAIEGYTGTEKLNMTTNTVGIAGNTIFSNLVINSTVESGSTSLFANGFNLTIKEDVTTIKRIGVFGGKYHEAMTGDTHITILGGKYVGIWGGGLTGDVNGNTYVTVGGNVNEGDGIDDSNSANISPCYIWGGGSNSSVFGETHVTLKDNAVAKYVCGSGEKTKGKEKKTNINIEGGKVMNVYGGSAKAGATDLESCDTHITITGGMAEAIFGGSEQNSMTGNTYVYLKGGEVTRRVYTGCYNEYSLSWKSDNYVNGTTNLMFYPDAKVNTKNELSSSNTSNVGVFSGSRTEAKHDSEKNTIIYMGGCISNFENQIGDKSGWGSTLKSFENYVVDVKSGGSVEPVSAGVIKILPDDGNVAYVDNDEVETEMQNISEGKTVVVEFSKPKETLNIGIDYENEELTGFTDGGSYKIDGSDIELTNNKYSISSIIADENKTLSIVKKGDGTTTSDSDAQTLTIPARPSVSDDVKINNAAETITIPAGYKYGTTGADYADIASDGNGEAVTVAPSASVYIYKSAVTEGDNKAFKSTVKTITAPARKNISEVNVDFGAETINTTTTMQYSTNNGDTWNNCTAENMAVTAFDGWDGSAEKSVKFRIPADEDNYGSEVKPVAIPVRPSAPKVTGDAPTENGGDGKITGTTTAMEYKAVSGNAWADCSDGETFVPSGSYIVRVKSTGLSFAGTETATITVPKFSAIKEDTPEITINYNDETLDGFINGASYTIAVGENAAEAVTPTNGKLMINEKYIGKTISIVRKARDENYADSTAQTITLGSRAAQPANLTGIKPTSAGGKGKITGTTDDMQYKEKDNEQDTWQDCSETETEVTAGKTYLVRAKAVTEGETKKFASASVNVEVGEYVEPVKIKEDTPQISIDYINEAIIGFTAQQPYTIKVGGGTAQNITLGANVTAVSLNDTKIGYTGGELLLEIVKKARDADNYTDSDAQTLTIPARPSVSDDIKINNTAETITIPADYKYGTTSANYADIASDGNGEAVTVAPTESVYIYKTAVTEGDNKAFKSTVKTVTAPARKNIDEVNVDFGAETINTTTTMQYSTNNGATWTNCTDDNMSVTAFDGWDGSIEKSIKFRIPSDENNYRSEVKTVAIPVRPSAPKVTGEAPTENDGDGKITGTTTAMEYKAVNGDLWADCSDGETFVPSGSYIVRVKVTESSFAGTQTAAITVPMFSATKEDTPEITINYNDEALEGFVDGASYTIAVGENAAESVAPTDGKLTINEKYIGKTISIVRKASDANYADSTAQTITLSSRAAQPADLTGTEPTSAGGKGKITGTTADMQYKEKDNEQDTWQDCSETETEVTAGKTYLVRIKADANNFASECSEVEVVKYFAPLGFKINSLAASTAGNDGINVTTDIELRGDIINGPHTIIAVYDDESQLIGVQLDYSMEQDVFTFNHRFESGKKYTIKAMIWNDDMVPLARSYTIYFPEL